ncbi:MAG: hypothetical protein Q9162_007469 [Coniocarpon cinnabarinum]
MDPSDSQAEHIQNINKFLRHSHANVIEHAKLMTASITQNLEQKSGGSDTDFGLLWNAFIYVTKNHLSPQDESKLDRLAALVRAIKDLGPLTVNGEPVKTKSGTPWTDLPRIGLAMREEWNSSPPRCSPTQWASLNGFAARLTALDAADFSLYGIWALRDALETPRLLTERQSGEGDSQAKKDEEVSVDELLPAVLQWLQACGDKMVALTIQSHVYTQPGQSNDPAFLGKLASDAGIAKGGYSVRRWGFWKKRLHEISEAHDNAGGREKIAKLAYQGILRMGEIDHEVSVMNEDMDGLHGPRE